MQALQATAERQTADAENRLRESERRLRELDRQMSDLASRRKESDRQCQSLDTVLHSAEMVAQQVGRWLMLNWWEDGGSQQEDGVCDVVYCGGDAVMFVFQKEWWWVTNDHRWN